MIFPGTPEIVREMVTVAHLDLEVVKELLDARPSRARAALGWGFGDWKTAPGFGLMRSRAANQRSCGGSFTAQR